MKPLFNKLKKDIYKLFIIILISFNKTFSQEINEGKSKNYYLTEVRGNVSLEVEISDLPNNKGSIYIMILDEKKNEIAASVSSNINDKKSKISFDSLAPGKYTIQFFHDENNNQKLDFNLIGIPKEKFGNSNNVRPVLGPPKHEKMLFDLLFDQNINIKPVN